MNIVETGKQVQAWLTEKFSGHPVVFHHVPKCAGTSVARALRLRYLASQTGIFSGASFYAASAFHPNRTTLQVWPQVLDLREQILVYHMYSRFRCIAAHVQFSECAYERFANTYKFITVLREPVSRYISHYFWDLNGIEEWARITVGIDAFIESEMGARYGTLFGEFFSGLPSDSDFGSPQAVEAAKRNLDKFAVVGFLDDMPRFEQDLKRELGVSIAIRHQNKSKVQDQTKKKLVTQEIRQRITELCAPDIEIYNYAKAKFAAR
jgi:hypothetical protein